LNQPTQLSPDAATTLFNLPDYRVISVVSDNDAGLRVVTVAADCPQACPACAFRSLRMHSRRIQRVRDILVAGPVRMTWSKRRLFCDETACVRKNFSESTPQVPRFARSTTRLRGPGETIEQAIERIMNGPGGPGYRGHKTGGKSDYNKIKKQLSKKR